MLEVFGNLWEYEADARVITTNGFVKNNGEAVMGRGCALEAAKKYPSLSKDLGVRIKHSGNRVFGFKYDKDIIFTFPVKHNWYEKADIDLIARSALQLIDEIVHSPVNVNHFDMYIKSHIVIPRPGCGNGGLEWYQVQPMLEEIWDDRFHVITFSVTGPPKPIKPAEPPQNASN